jgi:hypothetical protein
MVAAPEVCPHCACTDLTPVEQLKDHLQEDIILQPRTQVTNFRHHIDRHRSSQVAQSILGDQFGGVLHADGYQAYNAVNAKDRQTCLAHLIALG